MSQHCMNGTKTLNLLLSQMTFSFNSLYGFRTYKNTSEAILQKMPKCTDIHTYILNSLCTVPLVKLPLVNTKQAYSLGNFNLMEL